MSSAGGYPDEQIGSEISEFKILKKKLLNVTFQGFIPEEASSFVSDLSTISISSS